MLTADQRPCDEWLGLTACVPITTGAPSQRTVLAASALWGLETPRAITCVRTGRNPPRSPPWRGKRKIRRERRQPATSGLFAGLRPCGANPRDGRWNAASCFSCRSGKSVGFALSQILVLMTAYCHGCCGNGNTAQKRGCHDRPGAISSGCPSRDDRRSSKRL